MCQGGSFANLLGCQLKKLKTTDVEKLQKDLHKLQEENRELKEKLKQQKKVSSSKLQRYFNLLIPNGDQG